MEFSKAKNLSIHEAKVHMLNKYVHEYESGYGARKSHKSSSSQALNERVHTHERKYICQVCGNIFKGYSQLSAHKRLHEEKPYKCTHCEKRYPRRADLNIHMRSHTGELPFACHLCERRFAIKVRLTYHLQKHLGVEHPCPYCSVVYDNRNKLKEHLFKHTGMPYRCDLCPGIGFARRLRFANHMLRVHERKLTDDELAAIFTKYTGKTVRFKASPHDDYDSIDSQDFIVQKV